MFQVSELRLACPSTPRAYYLHCLVPTPGIEPGTAAYKAAA